MTYIGQQPATTFDSGIQDRFTGLSTNTVTLTHEISAEEDILVVWNNIVQDKNTYSVGGTGNKSLTLGGTLVSADVVTVYYLNKVMQSVNPTAGSVNTTQLADLGISTAKLQANAVTGAKLNTDVISAQTELAAEPADTDEFMVSDGGVLKRIDYSHIKGGGAFNFIAGYANESEHTDATIDNCFTSTYQNYLIQYSVTLISGSNSRRLQMKLRTGGSSGSDHTSEYRRNFHARDSQNNTDHSSDDTSSSDFFMIGANAMGNSTDRYVNNGQIYVHAPVKSGFRTNMFGMGNATDWNGYQQTHYYSCHVNDTTAMTGFKMYASGDNLRYSHIRVYGIADS